MADKILPPFPVKGSLPVKAYSGALEIIIHRQKHPPLDPFTKLPFSLEPSQEMMSIFELAVNEQMFDFNPVDVRWTEMVLLKKEEDQISGTLKYCYRVKDLPPTSFLYLMAMLSQTYYIDAPIDSVEIKPQDSTYQTMGLDELWALSRDVPSCISVPFPVDIDEDMFDNDSFDLTIEFVKKLSKKEAEKVKSGLVAWDEMRLVGGFLLDFSEQEDAGNPSSIVQLGPKMVQLESMDFFEGNQSAVNCLINFAAKLNAEGIKVAGLGIE